MENKKTIRTFILCENNFIREGLSNIEGLVPESEQDLTNLPIGTGLIIMVPEGCSITKRLRMLSLSRLIMLSNDWRCVVLVNKNSEHEVRFSRLIGASVVNLHLGFDMLEKAILKASRKKLTRPATDSISALTSRQWNAIKYSVCGNVPVVDIQNRKTFYSHRYIGLKKIGMRHMHELRRVFSCF